MGRGRGGLRGGDSLSRGKKKLPRPRPIPRLNHPAPTLLGSGPDRDPSPQGFFPSLVVKRYLKELGNWIINVERRL